MWWRGVEQGKGHGEKKQDKIQSEETQCEKRRGKQKHKKIRKLWEGKNEQKKRENDEDRLWVVVGRSEGVRRVKSSPGLDALSTI